MADYKFVVVRGSDLLGEVRALQASVALRLDDPSDVVLRVNGRDATSLLLEPFTTDIIVFRDGERLLRGTVGAVTDDIGATAHYATVNVVDYRGRLDRRVLLADSNHNNEPDMDIVWDLITDAQSAPDGGMGISLGAVPAGVSRKLTFLAGETVRGAIDRLANVDNGFEWDINADREFVAFRGERGTNRQRVLDYGGAVSEVRVTTDPTQFANAVQAVGDNTTALYVTTSVASGWPRFDAQVSLPTIDNQALVEATANETLAKRLVEFTSFDIVLRDSRTEHRWGGLGDVGLGDTVRVVVKSGRLNVNEEQRVQAILIEVRPDGSERVTLETGGRRARIDDRQRDTLRRVADLELLQ